MPNLVDTHIKIEGPTSIITSMYQNLKSCSLNAETTGFLTTFLGENKTRKAMEWDTVSDALYVEDVTIKTLPDLGWGEHSETACRWQTVWSPCIKALATLSTKYNVAIHISYIDEFATFVGCCTIIDGKNVFDRFYNHENALEGIYHVYGIDALQEHLSSNTNTYEDEDILLECEPFLSESEMSMLKTQLKVV